MMAIIKTTLPAGWRWVKLGDVCDIKGGKRLPSGTGFSLEKTSHPYIRVLDFEKGSIKTDSLKYIDDGTYRQISRYIIQHNDVYLSIAGTIGVAGAIPFELDGANLTENATRLVIKQKMLLDRDFLVLFLISAMGQDAIRLRTNTVGQPKLALSRIATIEIPLPLLDEQKRIAAALNAQMELAARARRAAEEQLHAAKELPSAYLRGVFGDSAKNKWGWQKLGDVSELLPANTIKSIGDTVVTAITTACLSENGFLANGLKSARMDANDAGRALVKKGEILIARSNTPDLVGRVSMYPGEPQNICASDLTIRIWAKPAVSPSFLTAYLSYLYLSGYWKEQAGGASGTMKKITRTQILEIGVPVPDMENQNKIMAEMQGKMDNFKQLQQSLEAQLVEIKQLPSALLRRAFIGKL